MNKSIENKRCGERLSLFNIEENNSTLLKGMIFLFATSVGNLLFERDANALMDSTEDAQTMEYSDLRKLETFDSNPYFFFNLTLESGEVLTIENGKLLSSLNYVLPRSNIEHKYIPVVLNESKDFVIVSYADLIELVDSKIAFYNKSDLTVDPFVVDYGGNSVWNGSVIGEVKFMDRNYVAIKNASAYLTYLTFSYENEDEEFSVKQFDVYDEMYNDVVKPIELGLSNNGIDISRFVTSRTGFSGRQKLVFKNFENKFDLYEQTYDEISLNPEVKPDPRIEGINGSIVELILDEDMIVSFDVSNFINVKKVRLIIGELDYEMKLDGNSYNLDLSVVNLKEGLLEAVVVAEGGVEYGVLEIDTAMISLDVKSRIINSMSPTTNDVSSDGCSVVEGGDSDGNAGLMLTLFGLMAFWRKKKK